MNKYLKDWNEILKFCNNKEKDINCYEYFKKIKISEQLEFCKKYRNFDLLNYSICKDFNEDEIEEKLVNIIYKFYNEYYLYIQIYEITNIICYYITCNFEDINKFIKNYEKYNKEIYEEINNFIEEKRR